jgi:hypothetical protein
MAAPKKLLILRLVAISTIGGSQGCADHESMMTGLFLVLGRLMTMQAVKAFPGVHA